MSFAEIVFFVILLVLANCYLLYPTIIILVSKSKEKELGDYSPSISILISAHNEEKVIYERILNLEKLDYELNSLEVLVGSDCSTDETNRILTELSKQRKWLKVFIFEKREGKASVLNKLARYAQNDILVFTDANTTFDPNSIKNLVKGFCSEDVGGISGRLILSDDEVRNEGVEERKYWYLETFLKKAEGELGILIGANGGIFSLRRSLFTEIPTKKAVTDDFFLSLSVLAKGFKFKYEENAVAFEQVGKNVSQEFHRKVRFTSTNFQTMLFFPGLLFNKYLLVSYAFWSHKVLRWFLPFQLIILLCTNALIVNLNSLYVVTITIQAIFYSLGIIGAILAKFRIRFVIFSLPYFFLVTIIALFIGFIRFVKKKHSVIWESTERY